MNPQRGAGGPHRLQREATLQPRMDRLFDPLGNLFNSGTRLGKGNFGTVNKCIYDGKTVAIKEINFSNQSPSKLFDSET
ncbi:MAG: hypothetical protein GY823_01730 [Flavobacteriaceae bacterium]|nr:hypothetical protein [Flavobacteriaceae bacterium]